MNISIIPGRTARSTVVEFSGQIIDIISDKERKAFNIENFDLKKAVDKYLDGHWPDQVFVKSPTITDPPRGDMYTKNNWDEVKRTLKPVKARVVALEQEPVIISTYDFCNNTESVSSKCSGSISHEVEETFSSTWSKETALTIGQEITYNINFVPKVLSFGGKTNWSVTNKWNNSMSKSKQVGLGVSTSVEVDLRPKQKVQASLTATHGILKVKVYYEASLSGDVVAYYSKKHEDSRFWALPVENLLEEYDLPNCVECTETLSIGFYSNARVEIQDQ